MGRRVQGCLTIRRAQRLSLKLLRQVQGLANAGGGWLVIGFTLDSSGLLVPDPVHTDTIAATYEPTQLSQQVNTSIERGQRLVIDVYLMPHPETRLRYPVIGVRGFGRTPFICRSTRSDPDTGEVILEQGAAYIRRPSAETSRVSTAADWDDLISRAVQNRRAEFSRELRELLSGLPDPPARASLERWTEQTQRRAFEGEGHDR